MLLRLSLNQARNFSLTSFFLDNGFECDKFLKKCMMQGAKPASVALA